MSLSRNLSVAGISAILALSTAGPSFGDQLKCQCVLATSLCNFARYDEAAGKPRQRWVQDVFDPPGRRLSTSELAANCWRKRDVKGGGEGLCCSKSNAEDDADLYFRGER